MSTGIYMKVFGSGRTSYSAGFEAIMLAAQAYEREFDQTASGFRIRWINPVSSTGHQVR